MTVGQTHGRDVKLLPIPLPEVGASPLSPGAEQQLPPREEGLTWNGDECKVASK